MLPMTTMARTCDGNQVPPLDPVYTGAAAHQAAEWRGKRRLRSDAEQSEALDADSSNGGSDEVSSNGGGEDEHARPARRKRKSTHTVRKEEIQQLRTEAQALESCMAALRSQPHIQLGEKALLNLLMREMRRAQQLSLAVAQSAVSSSLSAEQSNPVHSSIHLGKNWTERRQTLVGMHDDQINSTFEYVRARSQLLAPCAAHHSEERFETTGGDFCCTRFDVIPFKDAASVKQVFDAIMSYSLNLEINVSAQLGQLTVREDYDSVGASILDFRLLSTNCGVQVESHAAVFAQYFESHELSGGAPCAVYLMDSVDNDELHPYRPSERLRKDVTQAMVLTTHTRPKPDGSDETVVVLRVAKFLKLHRAEFAISPRVVQGIRNSMCWAPVLMTTISDLVYQDKSGSTEV